MTSQKEQIQTLIAEIDRVLQKPTPRLPWGLAGETAQQRRVLEKVRNFLVSLQKRPIDAGGMGPAPNLMAYDISYQQPVGQRPAPDGSAHHLLQTVMQEMSALRSSLIQPLQLELDALRQQRDLMIQELRQLEAHRQQYSLPATQSQLSPEVVQLLLDRLQATLPQQIAQALQTSAPGALPSATPSSAVADQLVLNFDRSLHIMVDSLKRDMQAYQESLTQGLDRMHTLGQQGEMMFSAMINHLAQQLGREASSFLQASQAADSSRSEASPSPPPTGQTYSPTNPPPAPKPTSGLAFPYPGVELTPSVPNPASGVDAAIDAWIRSVGVSSRDDETDALDLNDLDLSDLTSVEPPSVPPPADNASEIDAARKLSEQFNPEPIHPDPEAATTQTGTSGTGQAAIGAIAASERLASEHLSDDARDELDEFYESLFGPSHAADSTDAFESEADPANPSQEASLSFDQEVANLAGEEEPLLREDLAIPELAEMSEPATADPDARPTWNADLPGSQPTSPVSAGNDEIRSLSDLFDSQPSDLTAASVTLSPEDDRYIPASPDEDLLPLTDPSEPEANAAIEVDELTLNRLSEDLFNLETDFTPLSTPAANELDRRNVTGDDLSLAELLSDPSDQAAEVAAAEAPEWPLSLDDFAASIPDADSAPAPTEVLPPAAIPARRGGEPPSPAPESPQDEPPVFTLEGMDDLFANLPLVTELPVPPPAPTSSPEDTLAFTLEGMDDLFADLPAVQSIEPTALQAPASLANTDSPVIDATPAPSPTQADTTDPNSHTALPLEAHGESFADLSADLLAAPPLDAASRQPPPEKKMG